MQLDCDVSFFLFQAEDGIRDIGVTGVQTCALPIFHADPMDDRTGDPREFMSHSRWHRFLIAIAGPTMNILLAIVLLTGVFMFHSEYSASMNEPAIVGGVEADSPAAKIGIQPGDRIVKVD